jgi:hypothetical protein
MTFRLPNCEKGLEMLALYRTRKETTAGTAVDEPFHDASSHYADALRVLSEAERGGMLGRGVKGASAAGYPFGRAGGGQGVRVITGFRGDTRDRPPSILEQYFPTGPRTKVIR